MRPRSGVEYIRWMFLLFTVLAIAAAAGPLGLAVGLMYALLNVM